MFLPVIGILIPEVRRSDARSSTSQLDYVGRNENRFCDYRLTGRGPLRGFDCGPTLSDTARRPSLET